jgi:drug/metabolite transporter (DMT)-like permease
MSPLALLYVIGTIFMASLWRIVVKSKTKPTVNDLSFAALIDGSAAIITIVIFLCSKTPFSVPMHLLPWLGLGASIVLSTIGDYLILVSSKYADVADTSILLPLSNLWIALIAVVALGESITPFRWLAIGCIVVGSMITIAKTGRILLNKGIIAVLIYGIVNAIMVNIDKGVSPNFSLYVYIIIAYGTSSIILSFLLGRHALQTLKLEWKRQGWWLVVIGATWALFSIMILSAYKLADVSTVIPFMRLFIVITTAYSLIFLKERERIWQKIIGSVIVTVGAILLAYVG